MACDPDFANVSLLLLMDGANGSNVFVDSSPNALTGITSTGAVQSNASPLVPPTCGDFAAGGLYVPVGVPGDPMDFAGGDFTLEFFYQSTSSAFQFVYDNYGGGQGFIGEFNASGGGRILVQQGAGGGSPDGPPGTFNDGNWHHYALVSQAGILQAFIDGTCGSAGTPTLSTGTPVVNFEVVHASSHFDGQMQGFRITKGIARYPTSTSLSNTFVFTPPTAPFGLACVGPVTVPDVVGLDDASAQSAIIAATLTVGTVSGVLDPSPPGTVLSQSPLAGAVVASGSPVDLTESTGLVVPDVFNTSLSVVAPSILAAASFVVGVVTYAPSGIIIAGNVISQSPAAGTFASGGSGVNLVVSTGLPALRVPDIFDLSQADAINLLLSLGLVPGAISSAPSQFVPAGLVQAQNPSAGTAVAAGTIVSFVLSLGAPATGTAFDFEATVISQYANSPTILQLVSNLNQYIDQSTNFANFYNFVWNVDTAVGFGLDIWGKIVGVSRLLQIPNTTDYVGFDNGTRSPPDWQSMGSDQPPYNDPPVGGAMYTGFNATSTYLLGDDAYRQLILAKAFANICTTTAPAINTILQNLYGPGTAWVLNTGPMAISYNLTFTPSAIQLAILQQSGVIPTPPGVSFVINTDV
jgi:beta-lactam-binding protein with PASTA domain